VIGKAPRVNAVDLSEAALYRMAYGLAHQFREANAYLGSGRWRSNAAAGGTLEAIAAEVLPRTPTELSMHPCDIDHPPPSQTNIPAKICSRDGVGSRNRSDLMG
jgi:hypothetical protein